MTTRRQLRSRRDDALAELRRVEKVADEEIDRARQQRDEARQQRDHLAWQVQWLHRQLAAKAAEAEGWRECARSTLVRNADLSLANRQLEAREPVVVLDMPRAESPELLKDMGYALARLQAALAKPLELEEAG